MIKLWLGFPCWIALIILISLPAIAEFETKVYEKGPVTEIADGHAIINALINNPTIGDRLRADGMTVGQMTRQIIQPGVEEYVLYVHTCGLCNPAKAKNGFVTISADERPTYADGLIEYTVSFSIESLVRK